MDEIDNPALKATMTANIGVKPTAGAQLGRVLTYDSVNIYQTAIKCLGYTS